MAKVLKLTKATQALIIDGVLPGNIVDFRDQTGATIEEIALEINANTGMKTIVPAANLLTINGFAIFAADKSVVEM